MTSLAQYTFGSWVRRGFLPTQDGSATVVVKVNALEPDAHHVPMLAAGDVTGISRRQVIRSYPMDGVLNAEPNYLALVEFDSPELPWLFSPPASGGTVFPWMALVVVEDTGKLLSPSLIGTQLEISADQLPDLDDAHLWAHVQLVDADTVPQDPARSLARLLSPRRLAPDTHYLACVVPTLESARLAGLGLVVDGQRASTQRAWGQSGQATITLPVYHSFRFATGPSGDFETLVRRLRGVPLPDGLGQRRLRLDHPLSGMPAPEPAGAELDLHAALRPPNTITAPVAEATGQSYIDLLKARLADAGYDISLVEAGVTPQVGPPVYGQLPVGQAAKAAALDSGIVPPWLSELNLDPRHRVAAGLGAEVVRRNQDAYLESAWRQVGDVLAANRLRRRAEYSMATSLRLYRRYARLDDGDLLTITAPVHAKIRVGPAQTLVGRLRASPIPPAMLSVEFRRFSRSRGLLAHASYWQSTANVQQLAFQAAEAAPLVANMPLDAVETLAAPSTIFDGPGATAVLRRLVPELGDVDGAQAKEKLDALATPNRFEVPTGDALRAALAVRPPVVDRVLSVMGFVPHAAGSTASPAAAPRAAQSVTRIDRGVLDRVMAGTYRPPVTALRRFALAEPRRVQVANEIVTVAQRIADRVIRVGDIAQPAGKALAGGLNGLRPLILGALDPRITLARAVNSRIRALLDAEAASFSEIMAAPDLSVPTYDQLKDISHDWLLPGIDRLPSDTTTLVVENRAFINAFLVGVNHELGSELLWHEYPTDQRGTYARQFWNRRATASREDQFDLRHELHLAQGLHLAELSGSGEDPLVLVVKGELIHRYPGVIICAAKTVRGADGVTRELDPTQVWPPDFSGVLDPDVAFVGFSELTERKVREADPDPAHIADDAYWFFFAEHFAEPRFGLDQVDSPAPWTGPGRTWNDAAWQYATADAPFLGTASFAGTSLPKRADDPGAPDFAWAANAATQAWILLQFPFRRGIRALDLLPPEAP